LFGYSAAEIIGKSVESLVPDDRLHEPQKLFAKLRRGERVASFETIRRRKDGSLVEVELSLALIMEGNRPVAITGLAKDISDRKRAEKALRESEERYALAEKATNDGVWDWNPSTNEHYVSPRWKAMMGFAEDDLA